MVCPKATATTQLIYHPDRLKYPLKRAGKRGSGKWERIAWDEAVDTIAKKFTEIRETYRPESIAFSCGGSIRRNVTATRIFADSLGTPNWAYTDVMYCVGPDVMAGKFTYGSRISGELNSDAEYSKCAIAWGSNPSQTYITWLKRALKAGLNNGAKLVVIDPIFTETASQADIWLQVRPGTDGALALGMLNVIINEGLYDKDFVDKWCVGFDKLKERVQEYPPGKVAEITWVTADDIKK
jgi:anaerobic selenocysteine-containing dehydrogenase